MPAVTVLLRPKGLPMAITQSPTCSDSESPSSATGKSPFDWILRTARSVFGSRPRTLAVYSRLSVRVTRISFAFSTTWLLVMMTPSFRMINPDPEPRRLNSPCGGGNGMRNGNGLFSPKGPGGKPKPGKSWAAFSTAITLMLTTDGDACAAKVAKDGKARPDGVETAGAGAESVCAWACSVCVMRPSINPPTATEADRVPANTFLLFLIAILPL